LKSKLEGLKCGSGLEIRVGKIGDVVKDILEWYSKDTGGNVKKSDVAEVWMTDDEGSEEKADERAVKKITKQHGVGFKLWKDEKYYIDEYVKHAHSSLHIFQRVSFANYVQS